MLIIKKPVINYLRAIINRSLPVDDEQLAIVDHQLSPPNQQRATQALPEGASLVNYSFYNERSIHDRHHREPERRDPIAGKRLREAEKVTTGIHIRAEVHKTLKILAAIERRKFNAYIEEAIDDYLEKIADRIPDIS